MEFDAPPHNLDAEQTVLGSLMHDNEGYHVIADSLHADHFYDPLHGRLYQCIIDRIGRGDLADAVAVKSAMSGDEGLQEIGGDAYLADLVLSHCAGPALPEYAKIIRDAANRRAVIRATDQGRHDAINDNERPAEKIIEAIEADLFDIVERSQRSRGYISFDMAAQGSIDAAQAALDRGGDISGLGSGLADFDKKFGGFNDSDLIILAARPSMGKSAFAGNVGMYLAKKFLHDGSGRSVAINSLEMSAEQFTSRMLADLSGVPGNAIRTGQIGPDEVRRLIDAKRELEGLPMHIDDQGGIDISTFCARARRLKKQHNIAILIVDYLQLITTQGNRFAGNRVQEVSYISAQLKALAKDLKIPVIALSQLSRQVENRDDKRPQLSDLRESGSIEQDADAVLFLYREAYYQERKKPSEGTPEYLEWEDELRRIARDAELIIGKNRHGTIGTIMLDFDGERTKFSDRARSEGYENH